MARLAEAAGEVPSQVPVLEVRQHSRDELRERIQRLLAGAAEAIGISWQRADWIEREQRTLVRLTEGARAVVYHASGAMYLTTGLNPMEYQFDGVQERAALESLVNKHAEGLGLHSWAGEYGELRYERLWQIKAGAADRDGVIVEPVLFRIVGTYRHYTHDLPVWGPASVAIKHAGNGLVDSLTVQLRETTGKAIDEVRTRPAEAGARVIAGQLEALIGKSDASIDEVARPHWMVFGYLSLSKRKSQRLLEPVYVAQIDIEGEDAQGYVLVAPAADKVYMPLDRHGNDPLITRTRSDTPSAA